MTRARSRVLVIDDSAYNRRIIRGILEAAPDVEVCASAADGEDGLRLALELRPDVVSLDLEMPRMDGFTFLRILMAQRPTPVIVVSSYAKKDNVFRALELGAADFVAKRGRFLTGGPEGFAEDLLSKVRGARGLKVDKLVGLRSPARVPAYAEPGGEGAWLIAIGASTGGPPAIQHILNRLPPELDAGLVVSQHMPPRFTAAFAKRLDRGSAFRVSEAGHGDLIERGTVLLAPGGKHMECVREGSRLRVELQAPKEEDVYVPSVDALLASAAEVAEENVMGIVLTGMGRDGREGVCAIKSKGGVTIAESDSTAVVYGMPAQAIETGKVDQVLRLDEMPAAIVKLDAKRRR